MSDEQIKRWSKYQSARENAKKRRAAFRQWKNRISSVSLVLIAVIILIQRLAQQTRYVSFKSAVENQIFVQ
jgi:hypothetical protein